MNGELKNLILKFLASQAQKKVWLSLAVREATAWGQKKAKDLGVHWTPECKAFVEAEAKACFAARGIDHRGRPVSACPLSDPGSRRGLENLGDKTVTYPLLQEEFPCGPSRRGFDAPGGGQVLYWSATFEVVARVYRVGTLENATAFYFRVLDKRRPLPNARSIDDAPAEAWEWRDEAGRAVAQPAGAIVATMATEFDYRSRILPALKRIEESFFDSFAAERDGDASQAKYYDVTRRRWRDGLPVAAAR